MASISFKKEDFKEHDDEFKFKANLENAESFFLTVQCREFDGSYKEKFVSMERFDNTVEIACNNPFDGKIVYML